MPLCSAPPMGTHPAGRFDKRPDRRSRPTQLPPNRTIRLTPVTTLPHLNPLRLTEPRHNNPLRQETHSRPGVAFTP